MNTTLSTADIITLPVNTQGTDYVMGDLHGCYSLLQAALDTVNFDPARDRLFSVGDLVDRGPDSLKCLQLLKQPWFYAVLGNHERMLMDFFVDYDPTASVPSHELDYWFDPKKIVKLKAETLERQFTFLENGGKWIAQYYDFERRRMTAEFDHALVDVATLPRIMVVGEGEERFQVVHAELVAAKTRAAITIWQDQDIDRWRNGELIPDDTLDRMLWGRTLFGMGDGPAREATVCTGLSTTYCGHTIGSTVRKTLSHVCLDTGAFLTQPGYHVPSPTKMYGLTLFDTRKQQAILF